MNKSESIANLAKALSSAQAEVANPTNTAINPFYKSKYAPLPDVLNALKSVMGKYGLAAIQNPYTEDDKVLITTMITHESGEWLETDPLALRPEKNTPQGVGSAITYGRRYALSAVLGIASEEDDDGNSNETKKPASSATTTTQKNKKEDEKPEETTEETTEETVVDINEINKIKAEIMTNAREKSAKSTEIKTKVKEILAKYHKSGNPNKITGVEEAQKCLDEINAIKMEEKPSE